MRNYVSLRIALCLAIVPVAPIHAQNATGEITGLITDASAAVVPGAQITVTDVQTGSRRDTVTGGTGLYRVTALTPGTYNVVATRPGFKSVQQQGIVLTVAQVARVDLQLAVGAATETVTVSSAPPALDTESASLGRVVQQQAIVDLPLNGRDYLSLAKLTPGVLEPSHGDPTAASGAFVANGVRAQLTNYNLDGADNNSRIVDVQNQSYEVIQPSVDAIEEFKIETNNYSAEYGYSAGAVVNATLKSGTNQIHGAAFEFLRNQHLDARDFFLPANQQKQFHIRNQFGGVMGAPIVKNKTFLFASWERTAEDLGTALTTTLPSPALRGGNFQGALPIYDPNSLLQTSSGFTRTQFPNNTIPQSDINPISAKLITMLPGANVPGSVNNYIGDPNQVTRANRVDTRGDQSFSDNDKLFVRYDYFSQQFLNPGILPAPLIGATGNTQNNHATDALSATVGETHIMGPHLVNEAQIGYSRIFDLRGDLVPGGFLGPQYGFQGITSYPDLGGLPGMSITGYSSLGEAANVPNGKVAEVLQARESISWTHGNHTLKFGAQYEWVRSFFDVSGTARGSFSFTGAFTQNPLSRSTPATGSPTFCWVSPTPRRSPPKTSAMSGRTTPPLSPRTIGKSATASP
jgi:hypothetical protein